MQPQVTVLICNYNYSEYIEDAIDSAIAQDYPKVGVVIVDDASTDDSCDIIKNKYFDGPTEENEEDDFYCSVTRHNSGRVICLLRLKENGGPSRARNFGIYNSIQGTDFYAILDADDIMYPNKVSTMLRYCGQIQDVGVSYADYDILDTTTDTIITEYKEPYCKHRLLQECIVHSGAIIRKEALVETHDEFGFYDQNMRTCEDYDLWIRISEKFLIFHVPEVLTLVRNQCNNSTLTVNKEIWNSNWNRIRMKLQARNEK